MPSIASRDLRNHTAEVLRQVADGTTVTITVHGEAVAQLTAVRRARPRYFTRPEIASLIATHQADAALATDLDRLAGDTTEDLEEL